MTPIWRRKAKDEGAKVSLSGNLGFVSLDEVLRLISRSHQEGCVNVTGNGFRGRVFVGAKGVDLATTHADTELSRHLVNSGLLDRDTVALIESGNGSTSDLEEGVRDKVVELIREMTVESLYQIGLHGADFEVKDGEKAPFPSPRSFELESILEDAAKRASEWQAVSRLVPDLSGRIEFQRDVDDRDSITISTDAWTIVTEVGAGSSVDEIADRLGRTPFWTARVTGQLIGDALLRLDGGARPVAKPAEEVDPWRDSFGEEPASSVEEAAHTSSEEEHDPDGSWWEEPSQQAEDAKSEDQGEDSMFGRFAARAQARDTERSGDDDAGQDAESEDSLAATITFSGIKPAEDDTEAFLERVFSELGSDEEPEEDDDGYGLLRRRRLGTRPSDS